MRTAIVGRRLPDGRYDILDKHGKLKARAFVALCGDCRATHGIVSDSTQKYCCQPCADARRQRALEQWERDRPKRYAAKLKKILKHNQKRAAKVAVARVAWRNKSKINEIYKRCRERAARTGRRLHVDHVYPIQSPLCCGLHVHQNLRIISRRKNCSKGNGFPLENSPATRAAIEDGTLFTWLKESRFT